MAGDEEQANLPVPWELEITYKGKMISTFADDALQPWLMTLASMIQRDTVSYAYHCFFNSNSILNIDL